MKIFLLAITILLLISRIKSTPRVLSKTLYYRSLSKLLEKQKTLEKDKDEDYVRLLFCISKIIIVLVYILTIVYYLLIGSMFSSSKILLVLTAVQIVTVFISCGKQLNEKALSLDINDHKFHRFDFLFNVILDYIYYPMVIYLLII